MAWPIVPVPAKGVPVTDATATGLGTPVEEAANGFGVAVTFVESAGIPVVGGAGSFGDFLLGFDGQIVLGFEQANLYGRK
ncbi:hypothetical protein JJC00_18765 [Bradyrhizobium diazoefficiens]|uniref:hypothetical protein n=1 Tax=Bradyrhizobium diazoefficiens TaxID=1355477 RepID=UPI0019090B01|nr:hypothetical protein [Bradyrhizobium diazoefficiens]QQO30728.1 hypothetical protein JJC00_18765 [Bradyrhizobium diazoefficiens]